MLRPENQQSFDYTYTFPMKEVILTGFYYYYINIFISNKFQKDFLKSIYI